MIYVQDKLVEGLEVIERLAALPAGMRLELDNPHRFNCWAYPPYAPDCYSRVEAIVRPALYNAIEWHRTGRMIEVTPASAYFRRIDSDIGIGSYRWAGMRLADRVEALNILPKPRPGIVHRNRRAEQEFQK